MRHRPIAARCAARLQITPGEGTAVATARFARCGTGSAVGLRPPSAPAPLATAVPSPFVRGGLQLSLYPSPTSANPGCAGVSYGVWRRVGRAAPAGEGGEPPSLTLPPAALWRGLEAGRD